MAIDNTPPRLKLIVTIAIITVVTLVSLDFVFKSYYGMMTDEAQHEKLAPTRERDEERKAVQAALTGAKIPIDKAMAEIATGERPSLITPQQSDDLGPMTGWSKLPKPAPVPQPHAAPESPAMTGDAGAVLAGDAGAVLTTVGDAGAPHVAGDAGAPHKPAGDGGVHPGHH